MPTDPALCKRLAEGVFGSPCIRTLNDGSQVRYFLLKDYSEILEADWNPPENIAQAMMVAQRICQPGIYMEMELWERVCRVRFRRHETQPAFSLEPTAPLAIATAADAWLRQGGHHGTE